MRANAFAVLFLFSTLAISQSKQDDKITVAFVEESLENIFDSLSLQSGYFFSYSSDVLPKGSKYTIAADNQPIDQFLSRLLIGTGLKYSFFKDQIILNYEAPQQVIRKRDLFTISGKVIDEQGLALNGANVFLDGTSIGTFTDIDGNYKLESIPPGFYDLVFSHVGYENAVYHIAEYNGGARMQRHQMEVDLGQLEEVEVVSTRVRSSNSSWQFYYKIFTSELLGNSKNAQSCTIENPEVLNFNFNESTQTLTAFSSAPIIIRNDALGYRINYFLESFKKSEADLRYRGKISFRNLESISRSEKRTWRKNREESFKGSFIHFKRSLIKNELRREGFRVYSLRDLNDFKIEKSKALGEEDIVVFLGDHYRMDFSKYLIVEFRKEKESVDFLLDTDFSSVLYSGFLSQDGELLRAPGNQVSLMRLLKGSIKLDLNGQVLDKFGMTIYGYWSWERLGDLVPINYDPRWDNL